MGGIDYHHGLNSWASDFVNVSEVIEDPVKREARRIFLCEMEPCDSYQGTDGVQYPLFRFKLPDGRVFREMLFSLIKSSFGGAHFFMILEDEEGEVVPESVWRLEEQKRKLLVKA